ncbi:hypothetical protein MNBD_ALPHA05-2099, partial [hydrothermal vent metagenome]
DIALAARFADRLIWMKDGEILANGAPEETLTVAQMKQIFAVDAVVAKDQNGWSLTVTGRSA